MSPVSIYVAVYSTELTANLPAKIVPAVEQAGLPASSITSLFAAITNGTAAALEAVPGINPSIMAALTSSTHAAYQSTFTVVYMVSLAFGGVAIIAAFFVKDVGELLTGFVNKTIHNPREKGAVRESAVETV